MTQQNWLGLRHLALNVMDVEVSCAFYVDLLGYQVEWRPDADNVYLTSGQDNLALHKAQGDVSGGALDHLGFLVTEMDTVDIWHERIREFGAPVVKELRTHRDGARSFYFSDPDGNIIQLMYHPPLAKLPAGPDPKSRTHSD